MNMFSERVQTRDDQRQATRCAVLVSAENLFLQKGFKATTVRQIAADAGVSIGTVMAAGDKEALLVSIFDNWIEQVHSGRTPLKTAAVTAETSGDAAKTITALVAPFFELYAHNMELAREYGAILLRRSNGSVIFQELATTLKTELESVLEQHGMEPAQATEAATVVYLSYLGILLTWAGGAYDQHTALDQLTAVVTSVTNSQG